ncbi:ribonuclease HI [Paeniglutamicibacter sp. MACA_103]|uniref:ribonuclease HI n=1 Tax=Paeniglutamicibacter sp. MACA_103 TaxID=3377337 RepID=UPI0038930825
MQAPRPTPPSARFIPAVQTVTERSGVTVEVRHHNQILFWAVVRTNAYQVLEQRSGVLPVHECGLRLGILMAHLDKAIRAVRCNASESVYCDNVLLEGQVRLPEALAQLGFEVSEQFRPLAGARAAMALLQERIEDFHSELTITTDASRSWHSPLMGHGWILDYGRGSAPVINAFAATGKEILQGELNSIYYALLDATRYREELFAGKVSFRIRSDSLMAIDLLNNPTSHARVRSTEARSIVHKIHELLARSEVSYDWVKAHAGDPMNELADRLALVARRCSAANISSVERQRLLLQIADEGVDLGKVLPLRTGRYFQAQ